LASATYIELDFLRLIESSVRQAAPPIKAAPAVPSHAGESSGRIIRLKSAGLDGCALPAIPSPAADRAHAQPFSKGLLASWRDGVGAENTNALWTKTPAFRYGGFDVRLVAPALGLACRTLRDPVFFSVA
jgi:hypothetical protein